MKCTNEKHYLITEITSTGPIQCQCQCQRERMEELEKRLAWIANIPADTYPGLKMLIANGSVKQADVVTESNAPYISVGLVNPAVPARAERSNIITHQRDPKTGQSLWSHPDGTPHDPFYDCKNCPLVPPSPDIIDQNEHPLLRLARERRENDK